jgi:uncharacterized protein involved in exopolysaccharide biosynthesis
LRLLVIGNFPQETEIMPPQVNNGHNGHADTDMFDVGGFLRFFAEAVRLHKFLVLFTCLLTLAAATWYVYAWPPIYLVEAQLVAERNLDPSRDTFYASWQVFRKEDARDEVELFKAGPVLRDVIEKNKLTYDDVYHPFLSHAGYLWQKSWLGRQYATLKSRFVPEPEVSKEREEFGRTLGGLKDGIAIAGEGDSNVATVTVKGPTPRVTDIANSLIDSYLAHRKRRHIEEARSAYDVLTAEAERAGHELAAVRERRERFASENGLLVEFQKETQDVKALTEIEIVNSNHRAKISALEGSLNEISARLLDEPPEKVLSSIKEINHVRETAKLKRLELQTSLFGLRTKYREDSPEVQEALGDLAKLDALIAQEPEHIDRSVTKGVNTVHQQLTASRLQLMTELEGERSLLATQEETAAQLRQRLRVLPVLIGSATDLQREYDIVKEKYQRLLFRRMEAEVSATSLEAAPASVRIVDYASPPSSKFWPRLKYLYPGALFVGLAFGSLAAVIRTLTGGRLLRSDVNRGRIASPVYATIAFEGRARPLTVLPRQSKQLELPAATPRKETERSREAGA